MKKKFLTFILSICLVIPALFIVSACSDTKNNEDEEVVSESDDITDVTFNEYNIKNNSRRLLWQNLIKQNIILILMNFLK